MVYCHRLGKGLYDMQLVLRFRLAVSASLISRIEFSSPASTRISILYCGDSVTGERKHAILLAAVILTAGRLRER